MTAASQIQLACERLLSAYRNQDLDPGAELLPGLSDEDISAQSKWFPVQLPDPLRQLYQWRNGQPDDAWNTERVFWFRDMQFTFMERARFEYESMMYSYGVETSREIDGVDLRTCFPFASFNGGWYVYPCDGQDLDPHHPYPVVCVFQGIDVYFHSLEAMLATCEEWIRSSTYSPDFGRDLTEQAESEIWQKHNPGVFGRGPDSASAV